MNNAHTVTIDGSRITDFVSFHKVCKETFGFLDGYGENMDAWIDCMGDIHEDTGMSNILLPAETALVIEVINTNMIKESDPEIIEALSSCTAFVNSERIQLHDKNFAPMYLLFWS